ncbi:MAG: hypothetical protein ABIB97_01770 [Patescibacteria group bacterium]
MIKYVSITCQYCADWPADQRKNCPGCHGNPHLIQLPFSTCFSCTGNGGRGQNRPCSNCKGAGVRHSVVAKEHQRRLTPRR